MSSLLLRRVRIVPIGPGSVAAGGEPVDVLVEDGAVTAVGPGLARPAGVEEVDADGRHLVPGLWDQHTHLTQWTSVSQRLDLGPARSPEAALRLVADRVAEDRDAGLDGQPLVGWGHRAGLWDRDVTVTELDEVTGSRPVVLISGDGHHAWLNTTALMHLALPLRDAVVRETEWFRAYPRLATLVGSDSTSPEAFRRTLDAAAAQGVVGLVDFEFGADRRGWLERWAQGCDRLRVRWATYDDTLDDVLAAGLRTGDPLLPGASPGTTAGLLTMGPLKIISDGSLNTRTAWCCEPYADGHRLEHPSGLPNLSAAELRDLHARAHAGGLEVATHAIGDAAVTAALDAYAATGARGSIEHAQLVAHDDVRRMGQLGVRASVQPAHLLDDRDLSEHIWPGRGDRCFAFRWMQQAGVDVVLGSDAPVSPLDPWLAVAAAVHRSADDREAWHDEQALTVAEALAASVDGQPTVGVGSRGDLALLDQDPFDQDPFDQDPLDQDPLAAGSGDSGAGGQDTAASAARLRATTVALTVVAGRVVHRAL